MNQAVSETSTKPYLIRAIHEWCTDNGYTPYLAVAVDARCIVPRDYVKAGEIVLNVSSSATNNLSLGNEMIQFQARFGGVARDISVPVECISAVYSRENGHGMAFDVPKPLALTPEEETLRKITEHGAKSPVAPLAAVPSLGAVASLDSAGVSNVPSGSAPVIALAKPGLKSVSDADGPPEGPNPPAGGPPKLTRIK